MTNLTRQEHIDVTQKGNRRYCPHCKCERQVVWAGFPDKDGSREFRDKHCDRIWIEHADGRVELTDR
jgi:hypothetical protein